MPVRVRRGTARNIVVARPPQALREQLRCKEVWVAGADRYRNPDDDVPADFDAQRVAYYAALNLPHEAGAFVGRVQRDLAEALVSLDRTLPQNAHVQVLPRAGGWIALSPLDAQPEPANLLALKADLAARWPMRALHVAGLEVLLDCRRCSATVRTPRWFWF
jgi:hypothetical protein